jgi:L-arabinokinase
VGDDYGSVRIGAFMGQRILADLAGLPVRRVGEQQVAIEDPRWGGYLANVLPSEFERHFADRVPEWLKGADFLDRHQGTTDAVTTIEPEREYRVHRPTAHPIREHQCVRLFAKLLQKNPGAETRALLGELMAQSHASYGSCGLGAEGTDRLVDLVAEEGPEAGLYGAKITGGGSGGSVAVLGSRGAEDAVRRVADRYARETGREPVVFSGSSPGAGSMGARRLTLNG